MKGWPIKIKVGKLLWQNKIHIQNHMLNQTKNRNKTKLRQLESVIGYSLITDDLKRFKKIYTKYILMYTIFLTKYKNIYGIYQVQTTFFQSGLTK